MSDLENFMRAAVTRRAMIARLGIAGLGAAALPVLAGCEGGSSSTFNPTNGGGNNGTTTTPTNGTTTTPGQTFIDPANFPNVPGRSISEVVLNFAYLAEIIEADLYRQALNLASGRANTAPLDATVPASGSTAGYTQTIASGGIAGPLVAPGFLYLVQYAYVERAHRDFLRTVLTSLGAPLIQANPLGYQASFGNTLQSILSTIYAVEETGTRAYLGAAGFLSFVTQDQKELAGNAVAIYSTECRHSAALAYILGLPTGPAFRPGDLNVLTNTVGMNPAPVSDDTFEYYLRPPSVITALSGFNRS